MGHQNTGDLEVIKERIVKEWIYIFIDKTAAEKNAINLNIYIF